MELRISMKLVNLFFSLLLLVIVAGCIRGPKEGTVLNHRFTAAHEESRYNYYKYPYPCGTSKQPETCYMGGYDYYWVGDEWDLYVKDCITDPKNCVEGWVRVDETTYHEYKDGDNIKFQ